MAACVAGEREKQLERRLRALSENVQGKQFPLTPSHPPSPLPPSFPPHHPLPLPPFPPHPAGAGGGAEQRGGVAAAEAGPHAGGARAPAAGRGGAERRQWGRAELDVGGLCWRFRVSALHCQPLVCTSHALHCQPLVCTSHALPPASAISLPAISHFSSFMLPPAPTHAIPHAIPLAACVGSFSTTCALLLCASPSLPCSTSLPTCRARGSTEDDPSGKSKQRALRVRVWEQVVDAARALDAMSLRVGTALQRNSFVRSLVVAYVLALHLSVFLVLSFVSLEHALHNF
ncbi:unnamed protein product [Closterium sp. NIES-54]